MKDLGSFAQLSHYQESAGLGRLGFGQYPEEAPQLPAQPIPSVCVVPCRAPSCALQCVFSDPITYSSLVFSCLGLIILNPSI